jgi:hypothetical protein
MNTLRDLHDAFHELELRADAVEPPTSMSVRPHRTARRLIAPAASVAAVAAVALTVGGVTVWHGGSGSNSGTTAAGSGGSTPPVTLTSQPVATTSTATGTGAWQPPASAEALAAKARAILAGTATITVTDTGTNVPMTLPPGLKGAHVRALPNAGEPDGAAIFGTLTAGGHTGGFDLNVSYEKATGDGTSCDNPDECTEHTYADGAKLWISTWRDQTGGLTNQVELDRPDGAVILMHLSTERDPKGGGPAITSQLPLTVRQMTDFVTSNDW